MANVSPPAQIIEQTRRVLRVARERGVDPVLALHDAGLLWFPERELQVRADMLRQASQSLQEASVDGLAGRGKAPATAGGMKDLVASWLRGLADTRPAT